MLSHCARVRILTLAVASICAMAPAETTGSQPSNFSFIHMSDIHVEPYLSMPGDSQLEGARSYRSVRTIEKLGEVILEPYGITAPKPSFILATGDICEFSAPAFTWDVMKKYFTGLQKFYHAPGNHDNTWAASTDRWRAEWGGINYSYDFGGFHFMALNSASLLDPNPSFGREVIEFVKSDLKKVGPNTPVIPYFHHPLDGNEFASRYDADRLLDAFRPYNIVLIMDGHGHSPVTHYFWGIDGVEGGSTFSKLSALTDGYNIADVRDGVLTVAYKKVFETSASKAMIQKTIPSRSSYPTIQIESPVESKTVTSDKITLRAKITTDVVSAQYSLDDLTTGEMTVKGNTAAVDLETSGVKSGAHFARVVFTSATGLEFQKSCHFYVEAVKTIGPSARWRYQLSGGSKTTPLVWKGRVIVGANDGYLYAIDEKNGKLVWKYKADGEIISAPAASGDLVIFGDMQGTVHAVTKNGKRQWTAKLPKPIYAPVAVDEKRAYFAGRDAWVFALDPKTGKELWRNTDASYSIESKPYVTNEHIYVGAWDGYLYCIEKETGKTVWKKVGPRNQQNKGGSANRYLAPGDNGPVVTDHGVYITDRGSVAGSYTLAGDFQTTFSEDCSAIGLSADKQALYLRCIKDPVMKVDFSGNAIWKSNAVGGRLPISPVESDGKVYVCSNTGTLQAIDAATGELNWTYQVSPKLYVMSGITVANGAAFVCDQNGVLTAVNLPRR